MGEAEPNSPENFSVILGPLRTKVLLVLFRSFLPTVADDSQRQIYNRFQTKFYKSMEGYIMKEELGMQNIQF